MRQLTANKTAIVQAALANNPNVALAVLVAQLARRHYGAGYYSYLWAEVLSADAFGRFEEEGIFNVDTGRDFLRWILERGGSAEPMELFKGFRGREPSNEALLRHMGIAG